MKHSIILIGLCGFFTLNGSDQPSQSQRSLLIFTMLSSEDINKSHALIMQNIDRLAPHLPTNPEQREQKIKALDVKLQQALADNRPVSNSSYKDSSFQRLVMKSSSEVVGIIDFFVKEDNTGYIETVCTDKKHDGYTATLIQSALNSLKNENVQSVTTHIGVHDEEYIALHESLGFKKRNQTEEEKQYHVFHFEYALNS